MMMMWWSYDEKMMRIVGSILDPAVLQRECSGVSFVWSGSRWTLGPVFLSRARSLSEKEEKSNTANDTRGVGGEQQQQQIQQ